MSVPGRCKKRVCKWVLTYVRGAGQEVSGRHNATDERMRIDFIAYPQRDIIDSGFKPEYIGIECKLFNAYSSVDKALWQTLSYNETTFKDDDSNGIQLGHSFVFMPDPRGEYHCAYECRDTDRGSLSLARKGGVGQTFIGRNTWEFVFGGGRSMRTYARKHSDGVIDVNKKFLPVVKHGCL